MMVAADIVCPVRNIRNIFPMLAAVSFFLQFIFSFQAEAGIRDGHVTGVQTCALPISDNPAAVTVLRACGADLDQLRRELEAFLDETTPLLPLNDSRETQPTLGFQRVLQRAILDRKSVV